MTEEKKDLYSPEPDDFPKKGSSGNGGVIAYSVEARLAYYTPKSVAGVLLDTRWQKLQFADVAPPQLGIPKGKSYNACWLDQTGLLGYQAAQALRWWFLAAAEEDFSCGCVETRLIEHKIEYSYSSMATKAGALIGGDDRSNIMFGWGDKS